MKMKYKESKNNRYKVDFMRSTEMNMNKLSVKEFIHYLESYGVFEDYTVEYIDKHCVKCKAYDLEENSNLHKEFLVTEDDRLFYWKSLNNRIELVD